MTPLPLLLTLLFSFASHAIPTDPPAAAATAAEANAKPTGITVRVWNSAGHAIPGAEVRVRGGGYDSGWRAANGNKANVFLVKAGQYVVEARSSRGYDNRTVKVKAKHLRSLGLSPS